MLKKHIPYFFVAILLLFCSLATAQQKKKPMTNADVVAMIKAELPENTVILAIQQSTPNFDTSPNTLIQLKKQGITPKILDAMLQAQAEISNSETKQSSNSKTTVKEPDNIGVFYSLGENDSLKPLERLSGRAYRAAGANAIFEISGNRSSLRLNSNQKQNFVIRLANGIDPNKIDLVRMYLKDGKRAVNIVISGNLGYPSEAKSPTSSGKFPINISKFGESSYKLTPQQILVGGEYCFSTPNENSTEVFCFGLDGDSNAIVDSTPSNDAESEMINGVILVDGAKQIEMKYSVMNMSAGGSVFSGAKVKAVLNGNHAQLRITNTSPVFLLGIPENLNPSDYVALVKLDVKSDRREITINKTSAGIMSVKSKSGFPKDSLIPITIEEVTGKESGAGYKLYRVKIVSPIPANEYSLAILGQQFFDFGIDVSK
jgi:hypothetical protein